MNTDMYPSLRPIDALQRARDAKAYLLRLTRYVERYGPVIDSIDLRADLMAANLSFQRAYMYYQESSAVV